MSHEMVGQCELPAYSSDARQLIYELLYVVSKAYTSILLIHAFYTYYLLPTELYDNSQDLTQHQSNYLYRRRL